jgi:hypothetical protein
LKLSAMPPGKKMRGWPAFIKSSQFRFVPRIPPVKPSCVCRWWIGLDWKGKDVSWIDRSIDQIDLQIKIITHDGAEDGDLGEDGVVEPPEEDAAFDVHQHDKHKLIQAKQVLVPHEQHLLPPLHRRVQLLLCVFG